MGLEEVFALRRPYPGRVSKLSWPLICVVRPDG